MDGRGALVVAVLVAIPIASGAGVVHVPQDQPTLQAGVDAAVLGDTVLVASGTYFEHDIAVTSGVRIMGVTGDPSDVTVSAMDLGRVLFFDHAIGDCAVQGITITRGYHEYQGGGAYAFDSSVTFEDCVFTENDCGEGVVVPFGNGGALLVGGGEVQLTGCVFLNNHTADCGGALWGLAASVTYRECLFEGNSANSGGCIYWNGHDLLLEDCVFRGNHANAKGALYLQASTREITVNRCWFEENVAAWKAGALFASGTADLLVSECVFLKNEAGSSGSAIQLRNQTGGVLTSCTFVGNAGPQFEPVLLIEDSTATAENCIIAFSSGIAVDCEEGGSIEFSCSDIVGNTHNWIGCIADQLGTDGNIMVNPQFCDMGAADFTLKDTSPCAPENSPCGEQIGAFGVGCSSTPVEATTWGRLKAMYR